jgi:hypothetical protein
MQCTVGIVAFFKTSTLEGTHYVGMLLYVGAVVYIFQPISIKLRICDLHYVLLSVLKVHLDQFMICYSLP